MLNNMFSFSNPFHTVEMPYFIFVVQEFWLILESEEMKRFASENARSDADMFPNTIPEMMPSYPCARVIPSKYS